MSDDILDTSRDITPEEIASYIEGIQYPVTLEDIIYYATTNRADNQILSILQQMEPGVYHSYSEFDSYLRRVLY